MPRGKVTITAVLQNPAGVWEESIPVEYNAGQEKSAILQVLAGVRNFGLLRTIGPEEVELIPEGHVVSYNAKLSTIVTGTLADVAAETARQQTAKRLVEL
jgi:hypothetical protein